MPGNQSPKWQQAMWFGAGVGLLTTIVALLLLTGMTILKVMSVISSRPDADLAFLFASIGVVTLTLLRLLAILIGAAIAFAGLAVSFFAHDHATKASAEIGTPSAPTAKVALAAYAPGIVGLVVGAIVIVSALYARSKHDYQMPQNYSLVLPGSAPSTDKPNKADPHSSQLPPLEEVLKPPAPAASR